MKVQGLSLQLPHDAIVGVIHILSNKLANNDIYTVKFASEVMKAQGLISQLSHDWNAEVIYFISTLLNAEWRIRFFLIFQSNIKYLKYEH